MLLTISTTHQPATDLGYLLQKHPDRAQSFDLGFGRARVFFPEAGAERCTAALLLDIDSIELKRGRHRTRGSDFALEHYVNDRPYVASSFLSVAINRVFGSALRGRCKERPELAKTAIPLQADLSALPCRDPGSDRDGEEGGKLIRALFEPLGYTVEAAPHRLDERFPEWGDSPYFTVALQTTARLTDLLSHLYVLIPVLDDEKHYYVGEEEVDKLLDRGGEWLARHPARELIADRYLKHQRTLKEEALLRLVDDPMAPATDQREGSLEENVEGEILLYEQRIEAVIAQLVQEGAERVIDLGCGPGRLLQALLERPQFTAVAGVDVSHRVLERAELHLERMPSRQRQRLTLMQGSLTYRDRRIEGFDAAVLAEVIEHVDPGRLPTLERVLFEFARPCTVVVTTPNRDFNASWPSLPAGDRRHPDHRFEWTREEFQAWSDRVCERFGYRVRIHPIGSEDPRLGAPTQMAVFTLVDS